MDLNFGPAKSGAEGVKGIVCSRGSKILKILIWTFLADLASLRSKIMI